MTAMDDHENPHTEVHTNIFESQALELAHSPTDCGDNSQGIHKSSRVSPLLINVVFLAVKALSNHFHRHIFEVLHLRMQNKFSV